MNRLNLGFEAYRGGRGLIELFRDVAIVSGNLNASIQGAKKLAFDGLESKEQSTKMKELEWSKMSVDWRRALYIQTMFDEGYLLDKIGIDGYITAANDLFLGDMQKTYQVAGAILSPDDFRSLEWGKAIQLNTKELDGTRRSLLSGLQDGSYKGVSGYITAANDLFGGDMQKTYIVASAILSPVDFQLLEWGKQIKLNTKELDGIRTRLQVGLEDGSYKGVSGYIKAANDLFLGDMQKTYEIASAILSPVDFQSLEWGKQIQLNTKKYLQLIGLDNSMWLAYSGTDGQRKFADEYLDGIESRAYNAARAILDKETFKTLGWKDYPEEDLFELP